MGYKQFIIKMYEDALLLNNKNVEEALRLTGPHKNLLDIGCWDGENTLAWAKAAGVKKIYGLEPVRKAAKKARQKGIITINSSADKDIWKLPNNSIDCIVSNQLVEHLTNLDFYFQQAARVLKPGGYFINSTNNLSSWHNIGALLFGWAPFDLTNSSTRKSGIGNPLSAHRDETDERGSSWTHRCIYTAKWLNEWQSLYGIEVFKVMGAGYYPFPASLGKVLVKNCAFITVIGRKVNKNY